MTSTVLSVLQNQAHKPGIKGGLQDGSHPKKAEGLTARGKFQPLLPAPAPCPCPSRRSHVDPCRAKQKELGSRCCVSKLPSLRVMAVRPCPLLGSGQQGKSRNISAKEPLDWPGTGRPAREEWCSSSVCQGLARSPHGISTANYAVSHAVGFQC